MGLDFITEVAKHFQKTWDRGRRQLAEPTLFTDVPKEQRRTFIAFPQPGATISAGRQYEIAAINEKIVLVDGIEVVAEFIGIPPAVLDQIRADGFGCAVGHVHRIHDLSGAADVTIR